VRTRKSDGFTFAHPFYVILNPFRRVLLVNLTGSQLVNNFPVFYVFRVFITDFKRTRRLSLSWEIRLYLVRNLSEWFVTLYFLRSGVVRTSLKPQGERPCLIGSLRLLIPYVRSMLEAVPPSATRGRAMQWWQGPIYHGPFNMIDSIIRKL